MMIHLIVGLVLLFLIPAVPDAAVQEYRLENGLKVLVIQDRKAPLATFQVWYRVGSRDEPEGKSGISHLLEHMMFKGTPRYGSKVFSNIVQRNGGSDNAFTTKDYTMYFQTLASDRIDISIELEADRMTNLLLNEKDVVSERNVVMEERRMRYEDDPQNLLYEELVATALKAHPYRRPVIGWMSDISSIGRDDLLGYYKKHYAPQNAFIVVSGDVDPDDILARIRKAFGGISRTADPVAAVRTKEPQQRGEKRILLRKEAELPYVLIAYHVPSIPDDDSYALDVLSTVLSGGKSSRLYRSLVYEKRIALSAFADYSGIHRDPFLFILGGTSAPGKDAAAVEQAIYDEVAGIIAEAPAEQEVEKAKNQTEASFVFAQDSNYAQALYTGMFEMMGDWRLKEGYLRGIRAVSAGDLQRVAKKYFTPENRTVAVLIPVKKEGGAQ